MPDIHELALCVDDLGELVTMRRGENGSIVVGRPGIDLEGNRTHCHGTRLIFDGAKPIGDVFDALAVLVLVDENA